jgi:hypothetical protein
MALHPEHLDDLERRGDSLLDEERYTRSRPTWEIDVLPDRLRIRVDAEPLTLEEATRFANAVLFEVEILQRGDEIR